jgi:predicted Zn-dependent protease with MMP-like domain
LYCYNRGVIQIDDETFEQLIGEALTSLPGEHVKSIENIAITWAASPTPEQRSKLQLRGDQTLLGLYEGVPLSERQGMTRVLPDKITLFKDPLCARPDTLTELKEAIRHTLWHEIAHYYGLNHTRIYELEGKQDTIEQ